MVLANRMLTNRERELVLPKNRHEAWSGPCPNPQFHR
jgi:hypothetical protein